MIVAVTGENGRLGKELVRLGCVPFGVDITNVYSVRDRLNELQPDILINCAAITDVDGCEKPEVNRRAIEVNTRGPVILRELFEGRLIHLSTDYVFDGRSGPYSETVTPNPISAYGWSKYGGEAFIQNSNKPDSVIVRTTLLYGGDKPDFVTKILDQLSNGYDFEIPKRLSGSPTYVPHLADALLYLADLQSMPRIINIAGEDVISRYDFARLIADVFGYDPNLVHAGNVIPGPATRPLSAGFKLGLARRFGVPIYSAVQGLVELRERLGVSR